MKNLISFVVLAALAIVNGAVIEPDIVAQPIEVIESSIKFDASTVSRNVASGSVYPGDRLLYRQYFSKTPVANTVQSQDITYRGNAFTRLSYVSAFEVGYTQYATAYIISGGVGWSNVTVRLSTARGYGYNFLLEIWGR